MRYLNRTVAMVSGILLLPAAVYAFELIMIRTGQVELDQVILTVQIALFSLAWSWVTLRWFAKPARIAVRWLIGGLIVGFLCWEVVTAVQSYYSCLDWLSQYLHSDHYLRYHSRPGFQPPAECPSVLGNLRDHLVVESSLDGPVLLAFISGLAAAAAIVLKSERITGRAVRA